MNNFHSELFNSSHVYKNIKTGLYYYEMENDTDNLKKAHTSISLTEYRHYEDIFKVCRNNKTQTYKKVNYKQELIKYNRKLKLFKINTISEQTLIA